jgi:uncharacterized protein
MKKPLLACLSVVIVLALAHTALAADSIKVMLLDGQSGGPYHDWKAISPVLKKQLEGAGLFQVTIVTAPESDGDFSNFKPRFEDYDVVVSNLDAPSWPADLKASFENYMKNGGGLVVVHGADNAFPDWPAFNEMCGVGGWRNRTETAGAYWYYKNGKLVEDTSPGKAGSHGARWPFEVKAQAPDHPILKGLPKVWMHYPDELYDKMRGPGKNMTVIATAYSPAENRGTGRDEPMLLVLNYGKGRVFHTIMGHNIPALACVGFITTFQRGTEWAATGKVTQQSVPDDFPTADSVSYRVPIAKMDPDFEYGAAGRPRSR